MHRAALSHFGLEGDYRLFDIAPEEIDRSLPQLIADGLSGFNITIPHKETIFARCSRLSDAAKRACAVNTVKIEPHAQLSGHNTDIEGFRRSLVLHHGNCQRTTAAVIGFGGAAKAAILVLDELGFAEVRILARDESKVAASFAAWNESLAASPLKVRIRVVSCQSEDAAAPVQLIVNSTPIGQRSAEMPPFIRPMLRQLAPGGLLFDMVYARELRMTPLVSLAGELGVEAVDGTDMLVYQAAAAFEIWTGKRPPFSIMKDALEKQRSSAGSGAS
jgi:shikimate dehydrogenase